MIDFALLLGLAVAAAPCPVSAAAADIIERREGFYKAGSLPARYNNPGALKYIGQPGALLGKAGFAIFSSPEAGRQALEDDLAVKEAGRRPLGRAWKYMRHYDKRVREYYRQLDTRKVESKA